MSLFGRQAPRLLIDAAIGRLKAHVPFCAIALCCSWKLPGNVCNLKIQYLARNNLDGAGCSSVRFRNKSENQSNESLTRFDDFHEQLDRYQSS